MPVRPAKPKISRLKPTETISDAAQRVIARAQVYMEKHGLSISAMANICGFSDSLYLRRNGGIKSRNFRASLDVLDQLERGMNNHPHPQPPKRGRKPTPLHQRMQGRTQGLSR
jgi:hypothetical protein